MDMNEIHTWINTHIQYKSDTFDYWQSPAETLQLRTGDCEDFALLEKEMLLRNNVTKAENIHLWLVQIRVKGSKTLTHHIILVVDGKVLDSMYKTVVKLDDPQYQRTHVFVKELKQ